LGGNTFIVFVRGLELCLLLRNWMLERPNGLVKCTSRQKTSQNVRKMSLFEPFYLNADSDPESQTNADPDLGQTLPSQKVGF
jgi:hypothetical protein